MKSLTTRRQALAALRKLGYAKSHMQLARNATSYTKGGGPRSRLSIHLAPHGGFMITDRVKKPHDWGFSSVYLGVQNLREGATARLEQIIRQIDALGIPHPDPMSQFDLVVAIAKGAEMDGN
jgi:hypothetical protein